MIIPKRCIVVDSPKIELSQLTENLDKLKFRECTKDMEESWGFFGYAELEGVEELSHTVDRFTIINLRRDRKKVNKTKLSRSWRAELKKQEDAAGMVFDKPKREEVREQVKKKLLKEIDPDEAYFKIVHDSIKERTYLLVSDAATAEYMVEKLNRALEGQSAKLSFKADTLMPELTETLTQWLYQTDSSKEHGFEVGEDMMLKGEKSSSATLKHQEPDSTEVREHLASQKEVQKLKLITSDDQGVDVSFVISNTRILSQIDLKAICKPLCKVERDNHTDVNAMMDAEFIIWFNALSDLCDKVAKIPVT